MLVRYRGRARHRAASISILIMMLLVDASRTLAENWYFGIYFASFHGLLPAGAYQFLSRPELLFSLKLLTVITGGLILLLVVRKWLPAFDREDQAIRADLALQRETGHTVKTRLEQSEALFSDSIDIIPDGMLILDRDLTVMRINRAFSEMVPETAGTDLRGLYFPELVMRAVAHGELSDDAVTGISNMIATGEATEFAIGDRWLKVSLFSNRQAGFIAYWHDYSVIRKRELEAQKARAEAERASNTKTIFLAHMSHELRTPLNAIIGFSEMMKEQLLGPIASAAYRGYAADIFFSGHHLLAIINSLLDVSRIESGQQPVDLQRTDPRRICRESIDMVLGEAVARGLTVRIRGSEQVAPIHADPMLLRQILINLLMNAIKNSACGAIITVVTEPREDWLSISVVDTGRGIPAEHLGHVFDAFYSGDKSDIAFGYQSSGLGLHIVKRLIELHNGRISIQSKVNVGTTVKLEFPVMGGLPAGAGPGAAPDPRETEIATGEPIRLSS